MTTPHPQADLLRAIADGKQMQELDFPGINHPGNWCDCDADQALNLIIRGVEQYVRIKPETMTINGIECPAPMRVAPAAQPPAAPQEELREDASYESMNLAVMVLSDCGHSSNYKPLLERVAGRIDRHVERLLTAQRADLTRLAQAEPAHPTAGIWVPAELAERVQETMGEFLMDHGWRQQDMDTSDEFGALLAVATKAVAAPAAVAQGDAEDAARYRWLAACCRSTAEHWGGRWSIVVDGPAPKSHDSEDDFDAAIDAARAKQEHKP